MKINQLAAQLKKPKGKKGIEAANFMNKGNAYINQLVFDLAEPMAREKVLEIGPGNGKLISTYLKGKKSVQYHGIDYSTDMVTEAVKANKRLIARGNVSIKEGLFESIPYDDCTFDKVFSINTIYFLANPLEGLSEVFRVLKNGGQVVMGMRPKGLPDLEHLTKYGFNFYSDDEIYRMFDDTGFKNIITLTKNDPPVKMKGKLMQLKSLVILAEKP